MTIKSSYIFLRNLKFHAYHGVLPQEQITGNDYLLNVRIKVAMDKAVCTDLLTNTVSYADVFACIQQEMQTPSKLLEHVAGRIVTHLLKDYSTIEAIDLELMKINPPMSADCDGAGVELHLTRADN